MKSLIINGIDFNQRLDDLKKTIHEDIEHPYKDYFLMPCLDLGHGVPEILVKFYESQRDIDPEINEYVQKHFWELI